MIFIFAVVHFRDFTSKENVAELKRGLLIEVAWRAQNIFTGLCRGGNSSVE
jgi:hypothetical protein